MAQKPSRPNRTMLALPYFEPAGKRCFFASQLSNANPIHGIGFGGVWGLGFGVGVWGLGFGVWGLGFGVWGLGFGGRGLWVWALIQAFGGGEQGRPSACKGL